MSEVRLGYILAAQEGHTKNKEHIVIPYMYFITFSADYFI